MEKNMKNIMTKEMKIVDIEVQKEDFKTLFKEVFIKFRKHVEKVQNQYNEAMRLKTLFPETRVCANEFY